MWTYVSPYAKHITTIPIIIIFSAYKATFTMENKDSKLNVQKLHKTLGNMYDTLSLFYFIIISLSFYSLRHSCNFLYMFSYLYRKALLKRHGSLHNVVWDNYENKAQKTLIMRIFSVFV